MYPYVNNKYKNVNKKEPFKTRFEINNNRFVGTIIIGIKQNGKKLFYDLVNITNENAK